VRRAILGVTTAVLLSASEAVLAGGLDARVGAFFPRGHESLFQDLNSLYTPNADPAQGVTGSDFDGVFGGVEYNTVIAPSVEVGLSVDGFGRTVDTSYRDYTRPDGSEIRQSLKLQMIPLGATIRFVPTSKRARIAPYVGGGVDAVFYTYEEFGDFIDFFDPDCNTALGCPIYGDRFRDEGVAFGLHALGGIRFYLNRDFAIVGEGRYQWAAKDMGQDFAPNGPGLVNRIDLTGASFTVGLHVRF
jgi:hypothetical protein